MTNIKGIPDAIILIAVALLTLSYCTPAPAADDFWANQDRSDRQFDRYKADSDAYADRLDRDERRRERETANLLLCGPGGSASLCRMETQRSVAPTERSDNDQRFDTRRRVR